MSITFGSAACAIRPRGGERVSVRKREIRRKRENRNLNPPANTANPKRRERSEEGEHKGALVMGTFS